MRSCMLMISLESSFRAGLARERATTLPPKSRVSSPRATTPACRRGHARRAHRARSACCRRRWRSRPRTPIAHDRGRIPGGPVAHLVDRAARCRRVGPHVLMMKAQDVAKLVGHHARHRVRSEDGARVVDQRLRDTRVPTTRKVVVSGSSERRSCTTRSRMYLRPQCSCRAATGYSPRGFRKLYKFNRWAHWPRGDIRGAMRHSGPNARRSVAAGRTPTARQGSSTLLNSGSPAMSRQAAETSLRVSSANSCPST
jgi:hypothetical protein